MSLFTAICSFFLLTCLHAIERNELWEKLIEPTPAWMREQIHHDLQPFTVQLSRQNLDRLFADEKLACIRVRVVGGVMTIEKKGNTEKHSARNNYDPHFFKLHELVPLPNLDLLVTLHDHLGSQPDLPIFVLAKSTQVRGCILIPDWFALAGYEPDKTLVIRGNDKYPWEKKTNLLFFRGGDSGVDSTVNFAAWKKSVRPQLVALSNQYPQLIDAKFAKTLHHKQFLEQAKQEGFIGKFVPMDEYVKYKYLIDVDGNCASAPRLGLILHSNCVLLKTVTHSVQWFYRALHAWEHYIPLKPDLSDLLSQLEWAKKHPKEAKQISKNGRSLAKHVLSQKSVYTYVYKLLVEYAKKQQIYYSWTE